MGDHGKSNVYKSLLKRFISMVKNHVSIHLQADILSSMFTDQVIDLHIYISAGPCRSSNRICSEYVANSATATL